MDLHVSCNGESVCLTVPYTATEDDLRMMAGDAHKLQGGFKLMWEGREVVGRTGVDQMGVAEGDTMEVMMPDGEVAKVMLRDAGLGWGLVELKSSISLCNCEDLQMQLTAARETLRKNDWKQLQKYAESSCRVEVFRVLVEMGHEPTFFPISEGSYLATDRTKDVWRYFYSVGYRPPADMIVTATTGTLPFFVDEMKMSIAGRAASGKTVLHAAARASNLQLVEAALMYHPVLDDENPFTGLTPLAYAFQAYPNTRRVIELLLQNGADPFHHSKRFMTACTTPVFNAAAWDMDLATILGDYGADFTRRCPCTNATLLHQCSMISAPEDVYKFFGSKGIEVNARDLRGRTALHVACFSRRELQVEHLLKMGADPGVKDYEGNTAFHSYRGGVNGMVKMCKVFGRGVEWLVNNRGDTVLHSQREDAAVLRYLLDQGCSPVAVNHLGETPLHMAANTGNKVFLQIFFAKVPALVSEKEDSMGRTPFLCAMTHCWWDVAEVILESGGNPRDTDRMGNNAYHCIDWKSNTQEMSYSLSTVLPADLLEAENRWGDKPRTPRVKEQMSLFM